MPWTNSVGAESRSANVELASRSARAEQHVVERPFLAQPLEHRLPHLEQRLALELAVQVVGRLLQLGRGRTRRSAR